MIITTILIGVLLPPAETALWWLSIPLYNMGFINDLAPKLLISPTSVDEVIWDTVRTIPIFLVELAALRALGYAINRRLFPCLERLARASAIRIHGRLRRLWRDKS
ncbi:hypothetical protein [Fundidesulfovibrio butyratiphilus]